MEKKFSGVIITLLLIIGSGCTRNVSKAPGGVSVVVNHGQRCTASPTQIPISISYSGIPGKKYLTLFCILEDEISPESLKCGTIGNEGFSIESVKTFDLNELTDGIKELRIQYVFNTGEQNSTDRQLILDTVAPTIDYFKTPELTPDVYLESGDKIKFTFHSVDNSGGGGLHARPYQLSFQKEGEGALTHITDWIAPGEHTWVWPFDKELFIRGKAILLARDQAGNTATKSIELNNNEYELIAGKDWNGDFGTPTFAKLNEPSAITIHRSKAMCFYDSAGSRIRCIEPPNNGQSSIIKTIAGTGLSGTIAPSGSNPINAALDSGITHLQFLGDALYYIEAGSYLRKIPLVISGEGKIVGTGLITAIMDLNNITIQCPYYSVPGNPVSGCTMGGSTGQVSLTFQSFLIENDPESINFNSNLIYFTTTDHALVRYRQEEKNFELIAGNFTRTEASYNYGSGGGSGPNPAMPINGNFELSLPCQLTRGPGESIFVSNTADWQHFLRGYHNVLKIDLSAKTAVSVSDEPLYWIRGLRYIPEKGKLVALKQELEIYDFDIGPETILPIHSLPYHPIRGTATGNFDYLIGHDDFPLLYIPDASSSLVYEISLNHSKSPRIFAGIPPMINSNIDARDVILDRPRDLAVNTDGKIYFLNRDRTEIEELYNNRLSTLLTRENLSEKYLHATLAYRAYDDALIFSFADHLTKLYRYRLDGSDPEPFELIKFAESTSAHGAPVPDGDLAIDSEFNRIWGLHVAGNGNIYMNAYKPYVTVDIPLLPTMLLYKLMPCASVEPNFLSNESCTATKSDLSATVWHLAGDEGIDLQIGPTAKESSIPDISRARTVADVDGIVYFKSNNSIYSIDDNSISEIYTSPDSVLQIALFEDPGSSNKTIYFLTMVFENRQIDDSHSQLVRKYHLSALNLNNGSTTHITELGAFLNNPSFMTVDQTGNVILADTGNNRILRFHVE